MRSLPASLFRPASSGPAAPPAALEEAVRALEVVTPHERRGVLRDEAALLLDGLLVRVARSRAAIDVALCEGLGALSVGDRLLSLGWSGVGDYARERLGVAARTGQVMARLGRALAERPLLQAAVRSGAVSIRAAQEVVAVAAGADEAAWVERARTMTVRGLVEAVRRAQAQACASEQAAVARPCDSGPSGDGPAAGRTAGAGANADADVLVGDHSGGLDAEPWQRISLEVSTGARDALLRALDLAGQVLGQGAPRWQRLEAVAQEYLSDHGGDEADEEVVAGTLAAWRGESLEDLAHRSPGGETAAAPEHLAPGWHAELEAWLEEETQRWSFLERAEAVATPSLDDDVVHPARLDATLRELAALRERWESLLGHLALLTRMLGLWRDLQFASFAHYCRLCRERHNRCYADCRVMPSRGEDCTASIGRFAGSGTSRRFLALGFAHHRLQICNGRDRAVEGPVAIRLQRSYGTTPQCKDALVVGAAAHLKVDEPQVRRMAREDEASPRPLVDNASGVPVSTGFGHRRRVEVKCRADFRRQFL